jgi:DNA-binding NtrC family response regulator/tetratricopeptide (TPR) repeat protein
VSDVVAPALASTPSAPFAPDLPASEGALVELDARVCRPGELGAVVVIGRDAVLEAVAAHVRRRARSVGRPALIVCEPWLDEPLRELGARLDVPVVGDALDVARGMAARARGAVLVVRRGTTQWGRAVADELARLAEEPAFGLLLVLLDREAPRAGDLPGPESSPLVADRATPADLQLFWDALAAEAFGGGSAPVDLAAAEQLFRQMRAGTQPIATALERDDAHALARIAAARRGLRGDEVRALASPERVAHLVSRGLLAETPEGRFLPAIYVAEPEAADALAVAEVLGASADPWALCRASELFALHGRAEQAEASIVAALSVASDPAARADLWARWERAEEGLTKDDAGVRRLRSAELALRLGDVDRALAFARAGAIATAESHDSLLALGRAYTARGDLTSAEICLARARDSSSEAEPRARAEALLAELFCTAGRFGEARELADAALAGAADRETRLAARNVLGKILLAGASWSEAERHFAEDAWEAASAQSAVGELRARLNRAIAMLSAGRRDEAGDMLVAVLEDGERQGEGRAVAFAIANLATIATVKHDYVEALRLWSRAIEALRCLGDRIRLARVIANLAELRLKLGLVSEAEQALAFGRKVCGPGMPPERASHFALVSARVHLARGRTLEAASDLNVAAALATSASHGGHLADCQRVAARIALEDGDLTRAREAIDRAEELAASDSARAETALLRALLARAEGQRWGTLARDAFGLARGAEDDELVREAHLLLALAEEERGDERAARFYLDSAVALRDAVAAALPEELATRFLARRDLAELARTEGRFRERDVAPTAVVEPRGVRPEGPRERPLGARRLVGTTPAMQQLTASIRKIGRSDATVLVLGESGTGKELVAEALHEASARAAAPIVKVNCAALVETLLLSELFGHEKGSFTGAAARRRGRFELADGGTLFLDEIGDISANTQVALLRALQEKTFERVGGSTPIRVDVRVVCATHRDLAGMVARGEFREDLYYRLQGIVLEVPPLRARIADLPLIADAILQRVAVERRAAVQRLSPRALALLARHAWPGNVRELENALRTAALFAEGPLIEAEDIVDNVTTLRALGESPADAGPHSVRAAPSQAPAGTAAAVEPPSQGSEPASVPSLTEAAYASVRAGVGLFEMKRILEQDCIARALEEAGGNITRAATLLGMKRPRLSQLVKQYGLGAWSEESSTCPLED